MTRANNSNPFDRYQLDEVAEFPMSIAYRNRFGSGSFLDYVLSMQTTGGYLGAFAKHVQRMVARNRLDLITYVTSRTMTLTERQDELRSLMLKIPRLRNDDMTALNVMFIQWEASQKKVAA